MHPVSIAIMATSRACDVFLDFGLVTIVMCDIIFAARKCCNSDTTHVNVTSLALI